MPRVPRVEQSSQECPQLGPLSKLCICSFFEGVRFPVCPILLQHRNDFNETMPEGDDGGFGDFMASVDALVMGRKTFESVRDMEAPNETGGETGNLGRKLPNREDVRTHLTISSIYIHIIIDLQYTHVYKLCVYTILLHIHISYVLYRLITCLNLSILIYIVGICNICQWHVTILGSPVAPRWFRGELGPMVTHQYGSWRRAAWRSQNGWRETGPTVGIADVGWTVFFWCDMLSILDLFCSCYMCKKTFVSEKTQSLWYFWSIQFRNMCAPYGPYSN